VPERIAVEVGDLVRVSAAGWVEVEGARASALLEAMAAGEAVVRLDGVVFTGPRGWCPPDGLVFPHLSVRENLGYAGVKRAEVHRVAERLGLHDVLDRRPRSLTPAQRQATALGRAMLASPRLWLLDGAFSRIDAAAFVREEQARVGAVVVGTGLPDPEDRWTTNLR
jgi:ABC-type nitrate/sulfonate/bicarbonate transport system ATPase subunit